MAIKSIQGKKDICATCKRWNGNRKINRFRNKVDYDEKDVGECIEGGRNRQMIKGNNGCSKWEMWELLFEK